MPYFCDNLALKYESDYIMKEEIIEEVGEYYKLQYQQLEPVCSWFTLRKKRLTVSFHRILEINHKAEYVREKEAEFDHF